MNQKILFEISSWFKRKGGKEESKEQGVNQCDQIKIAKCV